MADTHGIKKDGTKTQLLERFEIHFCKDPTKLEAAFTAMIPEWNKAIEKDNLMRVRERIFIELVTSDRKPKASRECSNGRNHGDMGTRFAAPGSISHKVFIKPFRKSQFLHKSVNLFLTLVIIKCKLTDLCES